MKKPIIDGYVFSSAKETEEAKKEYESVAKLKRKLNVENIDEMVRVYNKLVSRNYFSTPIGLGFLHDMREYLMSRIDGDPLPPVTVSLNSVSKESTEQPSDAKYDKMKKEYDKLLAIKKKLVIAVAALVALVVGMFFIIVTNDNLGYFNAEEKVLDKYSAWQERLQNWEQELIEREDQLDDAIDAK